MGVSGAPHSSLVDENLFPKNNRDGNLAEYHNSVRFQANKDPNVGCSQLADKVAISQMDTTTAHVAREDYQASNMICDDVYMVNNRMRIPFKMIGCLVQRKSLFLFNVVKHLSPLLLLPKLNIWYMFMVL
jgi:hypothetical protein